LKNSLGEEQRSWTDYVKKKLNNYCKEPKKRETSYMK